MTTETDTNSKWTTKKLLDWTCEYLQQANVDQPRLSAEILLADVLGCKRIELYMHFDYSPNSDELARFRQIVRRCADNEPVAYLTGKAHFYSLQFEVGPAVLVPRPETELLAAEAIEFVRRRTDRPNVAILDMCTGSGCVAVAVAANAIEAEITAVDTSEAAIEMAQKNVQKHGLQGRIKLVRSDLFEKLENTENSTFDLILSNPPYISNSEYEKLAPVVTNYEPKEALLAGEDGLDVIKKIIGRAKKFLADNGELMLEVAYNQAETVSGLFEKSGYLKEIKILKDNLGYGRLVKARKK